MLAGLRDGARWVPAIVIVVMLGLYALVLLPPLSRSYPGDDTLILSPVLIRDIQARSVWEAITYVLAPDQPNLPRAAWKLCVLATVYLLGPSHTGLVWLGILVHLGCSGLVAALAKRIGLGGQVAWMAGGLHFAAYPGFHAYAWPVGIQHVLTMLGILGVLNLYLAAEQHRRAGRPYRGLYWAAGAVLALSSLSRASSLIGAGAVLAHVIVGRGGAGERLLRYERWAPPVFVATLYPIALFTYGGDSEALRAFGGLATTLHLLTWHAGQGWAFAIVTLYAAALLSLVYLILRLAARTSDGRPPSSRPAGRPTVWIVGAVLVIAWAPRLLNVLVSGLGAVLMPFGLALNSHNTSRWHELTMPIELVTMAVAGCLLVVLGQRLRQHDDALVLLPLFVGFGMTLSSVGPQPLRYWIYVTPVLAIALATVIDMVAMSARATTRRREIVCGVLAALIMGANIGAIRLELWRHKLADTYLALEYIRVADLISRDMDASSSPDSRLVCVNGLGPLPHEEGWTGAFGARGFYREYNMRAILSQVRGRRDPSFLRVDCTEPFPVGAQVYTVAGSTVSRDGRSVDAFQAVDRRLRELVVAGDYETAARLLIGSPRPFFVRYLLEGLPDDDILWITNGASVRAWLNQVAAAHDNWYGHADPKIQAIHTLMDAELVSYVRLLFLAQYTDARNIPPYTPGMTLPARRLPFGGIPLAELDALVRSDLLTVSDPTMDTMLREIVGASPLLSENRGHGRPRTTPDLAFLGVMGRLVMSGIRPPPSL